MSKIKPVFKCLEEYKNLFKKSRCLLTISVGQEVHEGEKFESTLNLVNYAFKECVMLVDDSLQRHTMALDEPYDAEYFYDVSMKAGDDWLVRNKKYYEKLNILVKIMRWNDWLNHENFQEKQNMILHHIKCNDVYRHSFENTIEEFLVRYYRRVVGQEGFNMERARNLCFNYLIEECAALCLWPETSCNFEVYPSRRNLVMTETHQRFVLPKYPNLLNAVAIKFKNRKQLKPQALAKENIDITEDIVDV